MKPRLTYHHGDLRQALIKAADDIISEGGIEAFSLRAAARRAGVSAAAPAYHFGTAKGLLTEVARLAFERASKYIEEAGRSDDVVADVRAVSLAFINFVLHHPGHFRLMFRNDLVDWSDPHFAAMSKRPGVRLGRAVLAYHGKTEVDMDRFEDAADMLCSLATLQGLASLVLEGRAAQIFQKRSSRAFIKKDLPRVIAQLYPDRKVQGRHQKQHHG